MRRFIIMTAVVLVALISTAGAAVSAGWHPWSNSPSWSNQRLTYTVQTMRFRIDDLERTLEIQQYNETARDLYILRCVHMPEGQEEQCVDDLGEFGVTDPFLESILP